MAGDTAQERTEPASDEKLRKARRRGEVTKSNDLAAALVLLLAALVLLRALPDLGAFLTELARAAACKAADGAQSSSDAAAFLASSVRSASLKLLPLLGTVAGGALLFPFLQVGPLFTLEPLAPKMDRLDPFRGLKRVFFELDNWTALLRTLLKLACVGAVCWSTVASQLPRILELSGLGLEAALACLAEAVRALLVRSLTCFVGLGVLDLVYQRWRFARRMRMTREEVKQEFKEDEGDPHAKQARRRMHEEIAQHSLVERARDADVIVVNPTHFACALRFRPEEDGAPRLIAKGADALAARLREVAREEDIPIVRDVRLARALYALELETEIPEDLYEAAIEVLRWVEEVARAEGWTPAWRGDPRKRDESD